MKIILLLAILFSPTIAFANSELGSFNSILIDPAHGGNDPGGIGIDNLKEKTLTLDFSKKISRKVTIKILCQAIEK